MRRGGANRLGLAYPYRNVLSGLKGGGFAIRRGTGVRIPGGCSGRRGRGFFDKLKSAYTRGKDLYTRGKSLYEQIPQEYRDQGIAAIRARTGLGVRRRKHRKGGGPIGQILGQMFPF